MIRMGFIRSHRALLLPVIITVSLLLVSLGMRSALTRPHRHKFQTRTVVESPVKQAKAFLAGVEDECHFAVPIPPAEMAAPPSFSTIFPFFEKRVGHCVSTAQLPSRAPPSSRA